MWVFVLFDLPVGTKEERTAQPDFGTPVDLAFEMRQFSVYLKFCAGKGTGRGAGAAGRTEMPPSGKVHLVSITDKQYENILLIGDENENAPPKYRTS